MNATTEWQLPHDEEPVLRDWDGECVVYNPLSGSTHILDIIAGVIFRRVVAGESSQRALSRHVAEFLDVPDDPGTAAKVASILLTLDELGLIEPAAGC